MSTVDNRIVNMTFNNKDFERNAAQSTNTLNKLEQTIANTGKSSGLKNMGADVQQVQSKFSALQVAGVTAIATITAKAVDAGLRMAKSLTIAPLAQGFQEYQTNLNSVQTIISNTGEDVNTVTKYLDKLNRYSDQTVYNFSEMARNIGTFTAAGVDLRTATDSIKGIANLAALSGSNSQQASTAMYQLSQAIAAGRVGLMDWNSVVNAGMGGKIFQTALARTGQNMGAIADGAIGAEGPMKRLTIAGESFRESIGGGDSWLNGDILVETLKQISGGYTEAQLKAKGYSEQQIKDIQELADTAFKAATNIKTLPQLFQVVQESMGSMWAKTFMLILGDFEQSKELWGNVGAAIVGPNGFVTKLNEGVEGYLKAWAKDGGRDDLLAGAERAFKNLWRIIVPFKNAFRDIFPSDGTNNLVKLTKAFRDFADFLMPSVDTMHQLRSVFRGVFAVLHIGFTVVKGIAGLFGELFGAIFKGAGPGRDGILSVAAAIGESLVALDRFLTSGGKFTDFMKEVGKTVGTVIEPIIKILGGAIETVGNLLAGISISGVDGSFEQVKQAVLQLVSNILGGLAKITAPFSALSGFFEGLKSKIDGIRGSFEGFAKPFESAKQTADEFRDSFGETTTKISTSTGKVVDEVSGGFDKVSDATDRAKDSVTGMFDAVSGSSGEAAKSTTEGLSDAAETATSGLQGVKDLLSNIASGIGAAFGKLGDMFSWVKKQFSDLFGNFDGMDWVAFFNAIFSGALILQIKKTTKAIDDIRTWRKIFDDTFGQLTSTMKTMQNTLRAETLKSIAVAVVLLAGAMFILSKLDTKELAKGLGATASLMAILIGSLKVMSAIEAKDGTSITSLAAAFALISFSLIQLSIAIAILGNLDMKTLAKGLGAMAIAIAIMVGAIYTMGGIQGMLKSAAFGIVLMSGAMIILAGAVLAFGKMDIKTLAKGLGAMAVGLTLVVAAMVVLTRAGPGAVGAAAAVAIVSGAMVLLAGAVGRFAKMDLGQLAKGLGAMAISLVLVVGSLLILSAAGGQVALAGLGLLLLAMALEKIALVVIALGLAPWKVVAVGLGFVAAALAILLLAGLGAMFVAPGLLALGVAVTLLGAGMMLAGVGMTLFAAGFAVLVATGVAGVAILTAAFHAFLAILPELATQLAASFVAFLKALANAAPKIRKSIGTIIKNFLGTIRDAIPEIGATFSAFINEGIRILNEHVPQFIDTGFNILMAFLKGLDKNIGEIAKTASSIIQKFLRALGDEVPDMVDEGIKTLIDFINGLATAIDNNHGAFISAVGNLGRSIANAIKEAFQRALGAIDWGSIVAAVIPKDIPFVPFTRKSANDPWVILANTIRESGDMVAQTMKDTIAFITSQNYPQQIVDAALGADAAQDQATRMAARVEQMERAAEAAQTKADRAREKYQKAREKARKKDATKKEKAAAKKAEKELKKANEEAKRRAAAALIQPSRADFAQAKVDKRVADLGFSKDLFDAVKDEDFQGAGDIKTDQAADLAQRAKEMLAKSKADQKLAEKLAKGNAAERKRAEQLRAQAQKEAELAGKWAQEARDAMDAATAFYQQAAQQRMADIISQHQAETAQLEWQKKFDAATTLEQAEMMRQRQAEEEAKATAAELAYQQAIAAAEAALASGNTAEANAQLDIAEEQAALAAQAAQAAYDAAQQAQQLADQAAQEAGQGSASGGSAGGGGNISQPSRTALEDAAKAVDRYTQSLSDAEDLAAAGQTVLQFNQTNTSPAALTASEIYRQSNNLLHAALTKISP